MYLRLNTHSKINIHDAKAPRTLIMAAMLDNSYSAISQASRLSMSRPSTYCIKNMSQLLQVASLQIQLSTPLLSSGAEWKILKAREEVICGPSSQ
mmetsp:Transcript_18991/g.30897  ORF Transcript_18991/g.30897 Transcript_18991/m.30897 type:complete len:95 (+) Transcript_18991:208-492(+)